MYPFSSLVKINTYAQSSEPKFGINMGYAIWESTQIDKMIEVTRNLGGKYVLAIVYSDGEDEDDASIEFAKNFINNATTAGLVPIIRLCDSTPSNCDFQLTAGDRSNIIDFYNSLADEVGDDKTFIAMIGPNEPGTGGTYGFNETRSFGYNIDEELTAAEKTQVYDRLAEDIITVANALQSKRRDTNMLLSPGAFNITNTQNDDFVGLTDLAVDANLFDYIMGNTYNTDGNTARSYYETRNEYINSFRSVNPDIKVILTEYGSFDANEQATKSDFNTFCSDDNIAGIMFFRSINITGLESRLPSPTQQFTRDQIRNIAQNCLGEVREGLNPLPSNPNSPPPLAGSYNNSSRRTNGTTQQTAQQTTEETATQTEDEVMVDELPETSIVDGYKIIPFVVGLVFLFLAVDFKRKY